jgi:riboflavin kinase/FMN adenylyltransferase
MKVYKHLSEFNPIKNAVVTTGTFDGVHIGHQKIIHRVKEIAHQIAGESVIITFHPHPRLVLFPEDNHLKMLNTLPEKIQLLAASGIDHLIIIPFTKEFSRLSSVDFIQQILVDQIGTKKLVIGYDHHFGKNREGSFPQLVAFGEKYHFEVVETPAFELNGTAISSTKIRKALAVGDTEMAALFLGTPFVLTGKVIHGNKLGRTIGFPTANLAIEQATKILPEIGVYAVKVKINDLVYSGVMNVGKKPTVMQTDAISVEVFIFDFSADIYDQVISVSVYHRLRGEQRFESVDLLKQQLAKDATLARTYLAALS